MPSQSPARARRRRRVRRSRAPALATEEREFTSTGAQRSIDVTCRVFFATTRTIEELVEGLLPDLRYRLPHLRLDIPPLRDRRADVLPLAWATFCRIRGELNLSYPSRFHSSAIQALLGYSWPGNVRELEKAIDEAIIHAYGEGSAEVCASHLRSDVASAAVSPVELDAESRAAVRVWALEQTGGNQCAAARLLGVHRNTIANWERGSQQRRDVWNGPERRDAESHFG